MITRNYTVETPMGFSFSIAIEQTGPVRNLMLEHTRTRITQDEHRLVVNVCQFTDQYHTVAAFLYVLMRGLMSEYLFRDSLQEARHDTRLVGFPLNGREGIDLLSIEPMLLEPSDISMTSEIATPEPQN